MRRSAASLGRAGVRLSRYRHAATRRRARCGHRRATARASSEGPRPTERVRQAAGAGLERRHRVRRPRRAGRADQHVLGRRALEARGREPGVGAGRFTGAGAGVRSACACRRSSAEHDARDDQREPERDGRLRATRRALAATRTTRASSPASACRPDGGVCGAVIDMPAASRSRSCASLEHAGVRTRAGPRLSGWG